jgi:hypothetical protein
MRIREAFDRIVELEQKRKTVPVRIPVSKVVGGDIVKLDPERKFLTNLVKWLLIKPRVTLCILLHRTTSALPMRGGHRFNLLSLEPQISRSMMLNSGYLLHPSVRHTGLAPSLRYAENRTAGPGPFQDPVYT